MRVVLAGLLAVLLAVGAVVSSPSSAAETVTLSVGDQSGLERDAVTGSVFVPIYLSAPASEPVVVSYWTVDGTATAGSDYTRWGTATVPRTLTIPAGATQSQVNVPILADHDVEVDETFSLVVTATGAGVLVGDDTGTLTIVDADAVSGANPAVAVSSTTVTEGDQGERRAQFLVHLSRPPATPITLTYSTSDGSAGAGADYKAKLPGTVVFAPGQISKTIDVLVLANGTSDGSRAFTLVATVTGGSPVEELNLTGTATVIDDDSMAPIACAPGTFNATDGNEPCTPAPQGTFVDAAGVLEATPCAPGTFQDQVGRTSCELAPIGSYVADSGQAAATQCPDGSTTLTTGSDGLDDCVPIAVDISAGVDHSCALLGDGTARCWGRNSSGQLGDGTSTDSAVPVVVAGLSDAVAIDAGDAHTCAVLEDGSIRCWGDNGSGRLGNGTTTNSTAPVIVSGISNAAGVSAGSTHTCAVLRDGAARCWGLGGFDGQLGNGTTNSSSVPVAVSGISSAVAISAGRLHSCALLADTSARCWGSNFVGRLGDGTLTQYSRTPVTVSGLTNAITISAGSNHSCAALGDGTARCWGLNISNALGSANGTSSSVPVPVQGLTGAVAITPGGNNTCAVLGDGGVRCWGANNYGQLGNGTITDSGAPVAVSGLSGAVAITAGTNYSCALHADGAASCWGRNDIFGQLGDGTRLNSNIPVRVAAIP